MGLVGWGRAFNLRFMPNGPLRTNCYHRPMPHVGLFGGGRHVSITENINIQQGPSGFWGFMTGLSQGLFGGGMFGMGSMFGMGMGGFSPFGALNGATTPQGAKEPQTVEDKSLEQLNKLYGAKKFNIIERPAGKFTATDEKGKLVASNLSFDDMSEALSNYNNDVSSEVKPPKAEKEPEAENAPKAEKKPEAENDPKVQARPVQNTKIKTKIMTEKQEKPSEGDFKKKEQKVGITVHSSWKFNTCTYTAVGTYRDQNGKPHDINIGPIKLDVAWDLSSATSDRAIAADIMPKLKAKAEELGYPNLKFVLPKDIANPPTEKKNSRYLPRS